MNKNKLFRIIILIWFIIIIIFGLITTYYNLPSIDFIGDLLIALSALFTGNFIVEKITPKQHVLYLKNSKNWIYKYTYLKFLKENNGENFYKKVLSIYMNETENDIKNLEERINIAKHDDEIEFKKVFNDERNAYKSKATPLIREKFQLEQFKKILQTVTKNNIETFLQDVYESNLTDIMARYKLGLYNEESIKNKAEEKEKEYNALKQYPQTFNFIDNKLNFIE